MVISERQNREYALRLNKASRVRNRDAARLEAFRASVSLLLVVVTVIFALLGRTEPVLAAIGFGWALASAMLLVPWSKSISSEAAVIQEHFDTHVFALPWNSARATKLEPERIHDLSGRFVDDESDVRDWYPDTGRAVRPFDVLLCQRANLMWDIVLRQRWAHVVAWLLAIWLLLGLAVGLFGDLTVWTLLLRWYAPSSATISLAIDVIRAQRRGLFTRGSRSGVR